MKRVSNDEVAQAWLEGREAVSHTGNFSTDGKKIYSYELQIGDTSDGKKIVREYTAKGSYGFGHRQHLAMLDCCGGFQVTRFSRFLFDNSRYFFLDNPTYL